MMSLRYVLEATKRSAQDPRAQTNDGLQSAIEVRPLPGSTLRFSSNEGGTTRAMETNEDLSGLAFGRKDMTRAILRGANLTDANMYMVTLTGAQLDGANLTGAELRGTNLADAYLAGAKWDPANPPTWPTWPAGSGPPVNAWNAETDE